jgi:hypothetical protein
VDQLIGSFVVVDIAFELVGRIVVPRVFGRVSQRRGVRRSAHPDPDDLIAFFNGIGPDAGLFGDMSLAGDFHALAVSVKEKSMIATANTRRFEGSAGEGQVTVGAFIFERRDFACRAKQDHRLAEKRARDGAGLEFPREAGDVPLVERKHRGSIAPPLWRS